MATWLRAGCKMLLDPKSLAVVVFALLNFPSTFIQAKHIICVNEIAWVSRSPGFAVVAL